MANVTTLEYRPAIVSLRPPAPLAGVLRRASANATRRTLNVVVAALGLVLAAPVMLVIAVLVKLTSHGPVLYTQTRVGLDRRTVGKLNGSGQRSLDGGGKPFTIYKFRTMHAAGSRTGEVWARPDDPRVTRVGRVLRKFRLDELPQLVNVLCGDMNVVGPRPEQPAIFVSLREQVEGYQRRQRVRPGITGWAQIHQCYDRSLDDVQRKVRYDLEYVGRQSVSEDLKIMLRTVPVMLFRRGAW